MLVLSLTLNFMNKILSTEKTNVDIKISKIGKGEFCILD